MAELDSMEKSDVESPGFEWELERYTAKGKKRAMDAERAESVRRKVRTIDLLALKLPLS